MTPAQLQTLQNSVAQQFAAKQWRFADKDPAAMAELKSRIGKHALQRRDISYSNVVHKVVFNLPNVTNGAPYQINVDKWTQLGSVIIGEFLSYISMESFIDPNRASLWSALVVASDGRKPSDGFFDLARELGLLKATDRDREILFFKVEQSYVYDPSTVLNRIAPFV